MRKVEDTFSEVAEAKRESVAIQAQAALRRRSGGGRLQHMGLRHYSRKQGDIGRDEV